MHMTYLSNLMVKNSQSHFTKQLARELRVLTQKSVDLNGSSIAQIELLDSQLFETALEMASLVTCLYSIIMTISGIGFVNGRMILGEVGYIHHFSTLNKLLAFAGLDPTVYQPGNFQPKRTRISKRGSRILCYAFMNAAHNVVKNNFTFKTYYDAKRTEIRSHYNALGHCVSKLVRVIWKMLTNNVKFNLE